MTQEDQRHIEATGQRLAEALAEALKENEQFYQTAASNVINSKLGELFQERAAQRANFAHTLARYADMELKEVEADNVMDAVHRGMMTIKAAMTIEHDKTDEVVIKDSAAAEKQLLNIYETTLKEERLPPALRRLLDEQYAQLKAAHSYVGALSTQQVHPVVMGLFSDTHSVQLAIDALQAKGIAREAIGVVAEDSAVTEMLGVTAKDMAKEGAGAAALGGGVLGGILGLVLGTVITLTFGPVLILGIPALAGTTALGTAIGASHGALFGALLGWGMAEEDVQAYVKGVREGQILLVVQVEATQDDEVATVLRQANGGFVATRVEPRTQTSN